MNLHGDDDLKSIEKQITYFWQVNQLYHHLKFCLPNEAHYSIS